MAQSKYQRYFWTSFWIGSGTLIGLVVVSICAKAEEVNLGLPVLWSLAYLVMGALIGFIFSVPKVISRSPVINASGTTPATSITERKGIEENTNLTQVSDWLTKVLIGAGLVQLKDIPQVLLHIGRVMGKGMQNSALNSVALSYNNNFVNTLSVAIIIYFFIWGFIGGYLVMKLILTEQFANPDAN